MDTRIEMVRALIPQAEEAAALRHERYMQIAELMHEYREETQCTHAELGEQVGKSRQWVGVLLRWRGAGYWNGGPDFNKPEALKKDKKTTTTDSDDETNAGDCDKCGRPLDCRLCPIFLASQR